MNIPWTARISTLLLVSLGIPLLFLTALVLGLLFSAFRENENIAVTQSQTSLEHLGEQALVRDTQGIAERFNATFVSLENRTIALGALVGDTRFPLPDEPLEDILSLNASGFLSDQSPSRRSDAFIRGEIPITQELQRRFQRSLVFDSLFEPILAQHPDAVSIYYISAEGFTRYHPVIGLAELLEPDFDVTQQGFFTIAAPAQNPERTTAWTPVYVDPAGMGLMVTVASPVYEDDTFAGVIGIDVTLDTLTQALAEVKPTLGSYAFIASSTGNTIVTSPEALQPIFGRAPGETIPITDVNTLLVNGPDSPLQPIFTRTNAISTGLERVTIDGKPHLVAYAPITTQNWTLFVVAPVEEISAEAALVGESLRSNSRSILRRTMLWLGILALLALGGIWYISRRMTAPIVALVEQTQRIAAGETAPTGLPVRSRNELGVLARSFEQMASSIHEARQALQQANQNLEATVEERTHQLAAERESLKTTLSELQTMTQTVARLTTPIIPVLEGVVVVPISGALDEERFARMQDEMLSTVQALRAHTVILDVTGIQMVDVQAAHLLLNGTRSLQLIGARSIISGVNPELAQHLVHSGVALESLTTVQNLQAAITSALQKRR